MTQKNKGVTIYTGDDAHQFAKQKARYGHRDWLIWRTKEGVLYAALCKKSTIKMAMLAVGTQGHFTMVSANSGHYLLGTWRIGVIWLANAQFNGWVDTA